MLLREFCRYFGWIVFSLVIPGAFALDDDDYLAIGVGAGLGLLVIIIVLCIVCWCACKKSGVEGQEDRSSLKSGPALEKVPPGVWMTNPQMYAGAAATPYDAYKKQSQQSRARNYVSEPNLNKPSSRYTEDLLKHLPATVLNDMMLQRDGNQVVNGRFYPGSSPDMIYVQSAPKPVARVDPSQRDPGRLKSEGRRKEDLVKEVTLAEEALANKDRKLTAEEITVKIAQTEKATARVFVDDFAGSLATLPEEGSVAKAFSSNQTLDRPTGSRVQPAKPLRIPTDETGENVARIYSSYTSVVPVEAPQPQPERRRSSIQDASNPYVAKALVRMDSRISDASGAYSDVNDLVLYDQERGTSAVPLSRSASNVGGVSVQDVDDAGPYGRGRLLRSPSNAQDNLDRQGMARATVQRHASDVANSVLRYEAPDNPNDLYAQPSKVKRQSSAYVRRPGEARAVIQNTPRPNYPAPPLPDGEASSRIAPSRVAPPPPPTSPPPPPPPPPISPPANDFPPPEQRMTLQEEMDQIRRARKSTVGSEGEETYIRAGSDVTEDAFLFLDNYSTADTASLRSFDMSVSAETGPELTSEAFQFLDKYSIGTLTDDEGASASGTPRSRRWKGKSLTSDAFRFLDEYI